MATHQLDVDDILRHCAPNATRCPAYCDCEFPSSVTVTTYKGHIPDLVHCRCGEEETRSAAKWAWHKHSDSDTHISGADVTLHPVFSQGTAIVRGDRPLEVGMVHFWEMRIITALAGTDVMFGVGTDKVQLDKFKFHFVSALGTNTESWGYSYTGKIQHNGVQQPYGQKFSQGCIVGVYLDRTRGRLEFFLNRRSLGVAYTNIPIDPNIELYPMVCSTAAKSVVRLINCVSRPECLQLRAFETLAKTPKALEELRQMPGLHMILREYWFLAPPVRYSRRSAENELDIADEAVLSKTTRRGRKQKYKDEDADINDLYSNAHKIASMQRDENDDDFPVNEYFDEYFHYML